MPVGAKGFIGIKKETTWGSRVVGDNDVYLPFTTENITPDIEELISAAQRGVVDEPVSYQGAKKSEGDVVVEVHPESIGWLLRSAVSVGAAPVAAASSQTQIEGCEDAWNESVDGGVVSSIDTDDYKHGSASVKLTVSADVGAGDLLATEIIEGTPLDMTDATHIVLWVKCSVDTNLGDLQFHLDDTAECATPLETIDIDALTAGTWKECTLTIDTPAALGAVVSLGMKYTVDLGECIIHIDRVRMQTTTAAASALTHVFTPSHTDFHADTPLYPVTMEVYRDQGASFEYLGAVINKFNLKFGTTDKILKATCSIIAKEEGTVVKTVNTLETTNPFVWSDAVIKIGGAADNDFENFSFTLDNKCEGKHSCNNAATIRKIRRNGYRTMDVSFTVEFIDRTEYDKFIAGTEQAFEVKWSGVDCEAGYPYSLTLNMPKVRYLTYPINVGGEGAMSVNVTGKCKYSVADGYAALFTLVNLEATYE